ncbi:UDP-glucose 4-epimerase GalE [Mycoplasmopsis caviae]|uniref:UDP-glucose 4-epimerase n=1 Tax=Mycoplasmopsis caviae TaxID=55603 RepID=A0A3P8L7C6_9BACT|nr:UDP-glucose 4-epimerase GalE [Mycoplasmopsis caviae]UUD35085.1 UDP-glucose 4-epimerase GalE [Mycoplasmopsis caviae]VDR42095.1 UDP-glucose 4-epimerase [Mycoplasmopsis caviae]
MTYLLIGGAGYIGSHVAEQLNIQTNNQVIVYDNLSTGFREFVDKRNKFIKGDILDFKKLTRVFSENKIDIVIYLAGLIKVGESVSNPLSYYETNIMGLVNVLRAMKQNDVNNLVFSSSAAIYGNNSTHEGYFFEDDAKEPCSPYGKTKYFGEEIIKDFAKANEKFRYSFLRYFNVAGASSSKKIGYLTKNDAKPTHLIPAISYFAFSLNNDFKIFGNDYKTADGTCVRDYVYVVDLAKIHILVAQKMIQNNQSYYFNVGSSKGFSNLEIVQSFERNLNRSLNVKYGPRRAGDPDILIASNKKICSEFNIDFKTSIDQIVQSEIEFRKKHLK